MRLDFDALRRGLDRAGVTEFVLFGSAVMYLHGLREQIGDVEFFTTASCWHALSARGWEVQEPLVGDPLFLTADLGVGVPVHAFYAWCPSDWGVCRDACLREAEVVHGLPCAPLWLVRAHKRCALSIFRGRGIELAGSRWEKHLRDLEVLDRHLHIEREAA